MEAFSVASLAFAVRSLNPGIALTPVGVFRHLLTVKIADKIMNHQQRLDQYAFG
ncbi:hypothetical protein JMY81_02925 [Brenneria goodwinii]|nr:hypothetical protein [Brenneria goodwinii]MCG8159791.1 hypothetical protein [Brenneria goodwinii]MCG8164110.1 hypothetical protein [Brenneria goodwinii]MCG8168719.1 hypothetical protein [Brenneria goodwinii]MCG8173726.1 hypothetical protein [Brenneria goodwinii]